MVFCRKCGKEIESEAVICIHCGCSTGYNDYSSSRKADDVPDSGLNLISFLIPIVGLILYCTNSANYPKKASAIGKYALIGFLVGFFFICLLMLTIY